MEPVEQQSNDTSWNQAEQYQWRLNELFVKGHSASFNEDYETWFYCLKGLYRELAAVMEISKKKDVKGEEEIIKAKLEEIEKKMRNYRQGSVLKIDKLFIECEVMLRKVHKARGMLMPIKDKRLAVLESEY